MSFISILIALLLERMTPQMVEFRQFNWFRDYGQWMSDVVNIKQLNSWLGLSILLLPILCLVWILEGMFDNALFGLFELAFSVVVVFFCLGPKDLDNQVDNYLDAIEVGDEQQRFHQASQITHDTPPMELPAQVADVSKTLFVEANTRIFAILFWFVLLGPVAAVLYRLLEQLIHSKRLHDVVEPFIPSACQLLAWIDWLPVRLTVFAYLISGSFEEGLQAFRNAAISAADVSEENRILLQTVGFKSIAVPEVVNENQAIDLIKKTRGLILRALVVWLLLVLVLTLLN